MSKVNVSVKWGKENFPDVEADLEQPPLVFKSQLFTLTGVPPNRMKVMIKGGLLKDDDWGKQVPKAGSSIMVMGSAEAMAVEPPKEAMVFMEDLPEDEQAALGTKAYGSGLQNLGNTCYMNSTMQLLYSVEPLRESLSEFEITQPDLSSTLVAATSELFKDLQTGGAPFPPFKFLKTLRERFPQFAQTGEGGVPMQQDAEECWTNMVYTLHEKLKDSSGASVMDKLFGVSTLLKLKSEESGEEAEESATSFMLKCNISINVNHLHEGIKLGLTDDREKASASLGRTVLFKGSSIITRLPPYLPVQLVRFFYKVDTQNKAKVLRKVSYTMELDVYDFCSEELKKELDGPRQAYKEYQDKLVADKKVAKAAEASKSAADVEMKDSTPASTSESAISKFVGANTGRYELQAVLTHKGRSADSGHYVSWVRQKDSKWVLFDDDDLTLKKDEEILGLSGGGDWHMAYLLLFKAITVPASVAEASSSNAAAAAPEAEMKDA